MSKNNKSKIIDSLVEVGAPIPEFDVYEDNFKSTQYIKKWEHLLKSKKTQSVKVQKNRYSDLSNRNDRNNN